MKYFPKFICVFVSIWLLKEIVFIVPMIHTYDSSLTIFCPKFSAHDFLFMIFYIRLWFSTHNFLPWFSVHDFMPTIFCHVFLSMIFCIWFSAVSAHIFLSAFLNDSPWFQDLFSLPGTWHETIICLLINQLNTLKPHYSMFLYNSHLCNEVPLYYLKWNLDACSPEGQFISIHPLEMNEVPQDHTYCFNKHRAIG